MFVQMAKKYFKQNRTNKKILWFQRKLSENMNQTVKVVELTGLILYSFLWDNFAFV